MAKEVTWNGEAVAFAFFTRDEAQTVEALTQRIFPDDDLGPGARQAGVLAYIDRALSGAEQNRQHHYRSGIRELDRIAHARFGGAFADCAPADQDSLIAAMASDALPDFGRCAGGAAFFDAAQSHHRGDVFRSGAWRQSRPRRLETARLPRTATQLQPRRTAARRAHRARPDLYCGRLSVARGQVMIASKGQPDVIVVGLGPAGATAAYAMAKAGMKVLALEAGPQRSKEDYRLDEISEFGVPAGPPRPEVQPGAPDLAEGRGRADAAGDLFPGEDEQRRRRDRGLFGLAPALHAWRLQDSDQHDRTLRRRGDPHKVPRWSTGRSATTTSSPTTPRSKR